MGSPRGALGNDDLNTVSAETDDARATDNPMAARRRTRLAQEAVKGPRRAEGKTQAEEDIRNRRSDRPGAQS